MKRRSVVFLSALGLSVPAISGAHSHSGIFGGNGNKSITLVVPIPRLDHRL